MVSHAYKFSGIVCRNKENPSIPLFSGREDDTAAAQLETGAFMFTTRGNEWIACLTVAAILELYTAFRIPQEEEKERS